jgi:DNA repair exonuclease SbcCD ATPase subunit
MRWLASFVFCFLLLAGLSWAEGSSSYSTGSPREASANGSRPAGASWERLDDLLSRLESSAEASSEDSRRLASSLEDARSTLSELSARLSESTTRAAELSSSLESCERSLELSESSLKEARALADRRELELRLWRGAAILGLACGAGGLACGLAALAR